MNTISPNRSRDLSQHDREFTAPQLREAPTRQRLRSLATRLHYVALTASVFATNAMAQGGGQGTSDAVQARTTSVSSAVQTIIYVAAGAVFSAAGVYHAIGVATGHKKWSDVGNVAGAMMAGGLVTAACTWLYT